MEELEASSARTDMNQFGYNSPLSLKGAQDKWYYAKEKLVVKSALRDTFTVWEDWKVEVIASKLLPIFHIEVLEQYPCIIQNALGNQIYGSYSRDYRQPNERYYTMSRELAERDKLGVFTSLTTSQKIELIVSVLADRLGKSNAENFVSIMCLSDYIMGNPDRHYDNYGVLIKKDQETQTSITRVVPLYDFGMGLFQNDPSAFDTDLDTAIQARIVSPFMIPLKDAYNIYKDRWWGQCSGKCVNLHDYDFPKGLGREYLHYSLSTLGVKVES